MLARQAGEGNDRKDVAGDYGLDEVEIENLRTVSKGFKNFVVVINCGGVIDVFVGSYGEAINFGRRSANVYIIED